MMNPYRVLGVYVAIATFIYGSSFALGLAAYGEPQQPLVMPDPLSKNILWNNLVIVLAALSGLTTAGMSSFLALIANGFFVGGFVKEFLVSGLDPETLLHTTLGHGVMEIIGFLLASAVGLSGFPRALDLLLAHRSRWQMPSALIFWTAGIAITLTAISAYIEVYWSIPLASSLAAQQSIRR